jgi:hypothetical protein
MSLTLPPRLLLRAFQNLSEPTRKRNPPPPGQALETMTAEVWVLKAELAKARADAAAAVTLAVEQEPSRLGRSVDRLRSRACSFVFFLLTATNGRRGET